MVFAMMPMTAGTVFAEGEDVYTVTVEPGEGTGTAFTVQSTTILSQSDLLAGNYDGTKGCFYRYDGEDAVWYRFPTECPFTAPDGKELDCWECSFGDSFGAGTVLPVANYGSFTITALWKEPEADPYVTLSLPETIIVRYGAAQTAFDIQVTDALFTQGASYVELDLYNSSFKCTSQDGTIPFTVSTNAAGADAHGYFSNGCYFEITSDRSLPFDCQGFINITSDAWAAAKPGTYTATLKAEVYMDGPFDEDREIPLTLVVPDPATVHSVTVNNGTGSGNYVEGDAVTITANAPESGKKFKEWTGTDGLTFTSGIAVTETATFTMPANDVTLTATYVDYTKNWTGSGSETDPYVISDTAGWNDLAAYVADGLSTEGMYFVLGDDISVTESVGTNATPFAGVFDGKGHTLTFNKTATGQNCAPFSMTSNAAFRNLHIDGTIETNHKFAGGLVGTATGTNTVTNCRSSIVILSSIEGDGTHGGFAGRNNVTYEGCVFDGKIIGEKTTSCGAFQGWNSADSKCTNCISDASEMNTYMTGGTFIRNGSETNLTNCYYMQPIGQGRDHGKQAYSVTAANGVQIGFGDGIEYDVSGITAYSTGLEYKGVFYAGKEEQITLTMPDLSSQRKYYVASAGELTGSGTNYTLEMPDEDVVISTESEPAISIQDAKVVLSKTAFTYNAKVQKPAIKTIKGLTLKEGTDYTAAWSNASSKNVGTYTVTITGKGGYTGTTKATYTINKATNPLTIKEKTATVKYSKLKKKTQTLAVTKVIKFTKYAKDKKTYTLVSAKKGSKSFKKYFKINKTTGKVTIKKNSKMKKGTYKVKVKVKALGNTNYKASGTKTVTFTVKVK